MIDKLTYEEVMAISKDLKIQADIVDNLAKVKKLQDLSDFAATVEGYSKFLQNTIEINKDADNALKDLIEQKKRELS